MPIFLMLVMSRWPVESYPISGKIYDAFLDKLSTPMHCRIEYSYELVGYVDSSGKSRLELIVVMSTFDTTFGLGSDLKFDI